jgi:hypothetical protein
MISGGRPTRLDGWKLCRALSGRGCACMAQGARPCPSVARLFSRPGGGWHDLEAAQATAAARREAGRMAAAALGVEIGAAMEGRSDGAD